MSELYHAFISYGRADSKEFAIKIYNCLTEAGFNIWFDQNDIPLGVDFQNEIDDGIAKADNFLFIISPHAVNSPYCQKEINLALKYNKRIIPLLHVEQITQEIWQGRNPQGTESEWQDYQAKGLHSSFANMHQSISKINWVYFRENIDSFADSFRGLIQVFDTHRDYVRKHTKFLADALNWQENHQQTRYLLIGEQRQAAEQWLGRKFLDQPAPCQPTDLHCEYICESIKNANNLMTQVFIGYADSDRDIMERLSRTLRREKITVWQNTRDIKTGADFQAEIKRGIVGADNLVYLISPDSLASQYCQSEIELALSYQKRIICLMVHPLEVKTIPEALRSLQFIELTDWQNSEVYQKQTNELIKQLREESAYYQDHKILLAKALKWQEQNRNPSILLRGYNLQHFQAWLKLGKNRDRYQPIPLQREFIEVSSQYQFSFLEVFISYSRTDSDLARKINDALQSQGKSTWFDQESIDAGTDFQQEIYRGIENSDNFLFIISPSSVNSPYCAAEVEYAQQLNKRFVTILYRPVDSETLPPALAKVQWIDFNQPGGDFYANFSELVRTLDTDRDHLRSHTKWSQRALEWQEKHKSTDLLLRGSELSVAEDWLQESQQENKQPPVTDLQQEYIAKSQAAREAGIKQEKQRVLILRSLLGGVSVALVAAIALGLKANKLATEATIKADAILARNLIRANPLEALVSAIEITGRSEAKLGQVLPIAQSSLSATVHAIRERDRLKGHTANISSVAMTLDGKKIVSVSGDKTIRIWDNSGEELAVLTGHENYISSVAITPDGKKIISGSGDKTIRIWDILSGKELAVLNGHDGDISAVAITPDGQNIVSASWDKTIRIWDINSGQQLAVLKGHEDGVIAVAITPDGQNIVSASWDNTIRIWDLVYGAELQVLKGHELGVISVAITPDGQNIVSGSWDNTIRVWNIAGEPLKVLRGHQDRVWSVKITPDGQKIVSGSGDKTIKVWSLSGEQLAEYKGHESGVLSVGISPDGKTIISASDDRTIRLWDMSAQEPKILGLHELGVISVAITPDGQKIVSGSADKTIRLWDISQDKLTVFKGHESTINSVAITPDGQKIVSGSDDRTIRLWDMSGQQLAVLKGHQAGVISVAISPDGKYIVSGSSDNTIRLWDISGKELAVFGGHGGPVVSVAISPDGKQIVSGSDDGAVRLWSISGEQLAVFTGHESGVYSVAISPDGEKIVSGSLDNKIRIWNLAGQPIAILRGHENYVRFVAITPDGQNIVSASQDNTIRVWNLAGEEVGILQGHEGGVNAVAIASDGQNIISGSDDKTIRLWRGSWSGWLATGCDRLRLHPVFLETAFNRPNVEAIRLDFSQKSETENIPLAAVKTCKQQVWNNRQKADFYVQQGLLIARSTGDFELAKNRFKQAQQLDPEFYAALEVDPETQAKEIVVPMLLQEAENRAQQADLPGAIAKFKQAKNIDPDLSFEPEIKAKEIVAATWINQAAASIRQGDLELAWKHYQQARELDPELAKASVWDLNTICWYGNLQGYATQVMNACEMAVKREPNHGGVRDSRGVARVLTGNYAGAISDFEAYINWSDNEVEKNQRQGWVDALRQGKNPLTEDVIKELLLESH